MTFKKRMQARYKDFKLDHKVAPTAETFFLGVAVKDFPRRGCKDSL